MSPNNIVCTLAPDVKSATITLSLTHVSLHTVLTRVAEIDGLSLDVAKPVATLE